MYVWDWYGIALRLGIREMTAKRWAREDETFCRIVHHYGRRVFAYEDELEEWRRKKEDSNGI